MVWPDNKQLMIISFFMFYNIFSPLVLFVPVCEKQCVTFLLLFFFFLHALKVKHKPEANSRWRFCTTGDWNALHQHQGASCAKRIRPLCKLNLHTYFARLINTPTFWWAVFSSDQLCLCRRFALSTSYTFFSFFFFFNLTQFAKAKEFTYMLVLFWHFIQKHFVPRFPPVLPYCFLI